MIGTWWEERRGCEEREGRRMAGTQRRENRGRAILALSEILSTTATCQRVLGLLCFYIFKKKNPCLFVFSTPVHFLDLAPVPLRSSAAQRHGGFRKPKESRRPSLCHGHLLLLPGDFLFSFLAFGIVHSSSFFSYSSHSIAFLSSLHLFLHSLTSCNTAILLFA